MFRIASFLIPILIGSGANAAELEKIRFAEMPVGLRITVEQLNGRVFTTTFLGREGDAYVTEQRVGEGSDGKLISRSTFDLDGQRISTTRAGKTATFTPHECTRILGECAYTVKSENGKTVRITMTTSFDEDGEISWRRYVGGREVSSGGFKVGTHFGWLQEYTYFVSRSGRRSKGTVINVTAP
ncbi:MAG: hypothetical protein AAF401_03005 [Pseudomonadota bacterium]